MDLYNKINNRESLTKSYTLKYPVVFEKAEGIYIYDKDGNKYIDCLNGFGVNILGHNHKIITDAGIDFFKNKYSLQILDMMSTIRDDFIDCLFSLFPKSMRENIKIQFSGGSGSDAVESAIELARRHTGRHTIMAFSGCYHGLTKGAMALTGNIHDKINCSSDVVHIPFPHSFRCPFGIGGIEGERTILHYIENILTDPKSGVEKPAAIIMEVVQSDGGIIIASNKFVQEIRRITKEHDMLLIIDEVQTGFGKTGYMFGFEASGIEPDIIVLSKALGGGMPLSAVVFNKKLDMTSRGTFRGNQIAMYLGKITFDYIIKNNVLNDVIKLEKYMKIKLDNLKDNYETIGEIRIKGMLFAIEFCYPKTNKYYPEKAKQVFDNCFKNKLLCKLGGRNNCTLIFWTSLIVTIKELDKIINVISKSIY